MYQLSVSAETIDELWSKIRASLPAGQEPAPEPESLSDRVEALRAVMLQQGLLLEITPIEEP